MKMNVKKMKEYYYPYELIIPDQNRDITLWYKTIESKLTPSIQENLRTKLIANKICFVTFQSPAFNFTNFKDTFGDYEHLIFLDVSLLKKIFNDDIDMIFPILLHEIGHLFNVCKTDGLLEDISWITENEYYADDFVRRLGFEKELLRGIEHYTKWKLEHDERVFEIFELRLKRLNDNADLKIGIDIDEFNKYRESKGLN